MNFVNERDRIVGGAVMSETSFVAFECANPQGYWYSLNKPESILIVDKTMKSSPISITRRLEFDSGHRIPNHDGQCRHLHGHRYAIEVTLTGDVANHPGKADGHNDDGHRD